MLYEKVGDQESVCIADEVPFEIPETWEWVRLPEFVNYVFFFLRNLLYLIDFFVKFVQPAGEETACTTGKIYKNAVFDTNRKSRLRHISAEKGLKQRAFEVPLCFTAELRKPFFCVFDCCWPVLRPLKLTPQSHLPEE